MMHCLFAGLTDKFIVNVFSLSLWLTLRLPGLKEGKKTPREGVAYPNLGFRIFRDSKF